MKPYEIYNSASAPGGVYLVGADGTGPTFYVNRARAEAVRNEIRQQAEKVAAAIKAQIAFEALPAYAAGMKDGNPVFYKRGKKAWWLAPEGTDPQAWNDYWKVSGEQAAALIAWVEA